MFCTFRHLINKNGILIFGRKKNDRMSSNIAQSIYHSIAFVSMKENHEEDDMLLPLKP